MKYIDFLRNELPQDWEITEELNINWDGISTIAIYKAQQGTRYEDSELIPIQLNIFSNDIMQVKADLEDFIARNQNKFFVEDFTKFHKQYYYTPLIPMVANATGNQLTNQIVLAGTLITSLNVSDIKEVKIDGEVIKSTTCNISYASQINAHVYPLANSFANAKSVAQASNLSIQLTAINKNNTFFNKLRMMRLSNKSINTKFKLTLTFTDNDVEEVYDNCIVSQYSIANENGALPVINVTFIVGG